MTVADRRVHSLRVRAPDDDQARRAAIVVEDALRTATFAGETAERVVVIRHLDVGVIPRGSAPASVALAMEAAVQRLEAGAIHGEQLAARDANVVYFRDVAEPIVALAREVARGASADAWYWSLVVRGWSAGTSASRAIRLLVERAARTPAGVIAAADVIEAFASTDVGRTALASIAEPEARAMLEVLGYRDGRHSDETPVAPRAVSGRTRRVLADTLARADGRVDDARVTWMAVMLLVAERPARVASAELPKLVRAVVEEVRATSAVGPGVSGGRGNEPVAGRDGMIRQVGGWLRANESSRPNSFSGGAPQPPKTASKPYTPLDSSDLAPARDRGERPPHIWDNPLPTDFAGFLFFVALLHRLGIATLLAQRTDLTERAWVESLLLRLARHLAIPRDDPAIAWIETPDDELEPDDRTLTATWLRAIRGHVRRDTHNSLIAIARRPGAIVVTRTHIDVLLHYTHVDITVRRAGLDFDPGWMPWLGRVVQFHYLDALPDVTA